MQKIRSFGETLKELKNMCNMKSVTLATYIGYDISYISKWCADKNLPSGRNVIYILGELSRIFSREIYNSNMLDLFNNQYGTKIVCLEELQQYIELILEDSYDRSKKSEKINKKNSNKTIFGKDELENFVKSRISEVLSTEQRELNIYSTLDILNSEIILQCKDFVKSNAKINLKIGCDIRRFTNESLKDIYDIHYALSKLENCNIQLFSDEDFKRANILLVKDEFAVIYSLDEKDKPDFGVVISDVKDLEKIYASISYRFKSSNIIVDTVSEEELRDKQYVFNFYNSRSFNFLFNLDFDFIDPKSMMYKIKNEENSEMINSQIANLETIVERKLKSSKVDIFMEKNTLNNYIYSSVLMCTEGEASEILDRIESLINYMEINSEIRIHMVKKISIYEVYKDSLSVYFGDNFLLMKKPKNSSIGNKKNLYYIVKNEKVLRHLEKAFENIKNEQYSRLVSREELIEFLQDYRNLL